MNVGTSKVMRCSRHVNWGRIDVRLNGDQLDLQCYSKCGTRTGDGTRAIVCRYADILGQLTSIIDSVSFSSINEYYYECLGS